MSGAILDFVIQPLTLLRGLAWLCSVIAFGVLTSNGTVSGADGELLAKNCGSASVFNCSDGPLDFTVVVGIFGFLLASFFLLTSSLNEFSSSLVQYKKQLATFEFGAACLWSFLFFVAFCFDTNKWTAGECECDFGGEKIKFSYQDPLPGQEPETKYGNAARSAIAFSFFAMIAWGAIAGLTFKKMFVDGNDQVDDDSFKGAADPDASDTAFPYAPFENNGTETPYTQYDDEESYNT